MGLNPRLTLASKKHGYLCVVVPKVGSTTVRRTLLAWECGIVIDDNHLDKAHSNLSHSNIRSLSEDDLKQLFVFCFVRNPYNRLFSVWQSKVVSNSDNNFAWLRSRCETFREFVNFVALNPTLDQHWASQVGLLLPSEFWYYRYDKIIRFEQFYEFSEVLEMLGAPKNIIEISRTVSNASVKLDIEKFIMPDLEEIIYELYRDDFEQFNYIRGTYA